MSALFIDMMMVGLSLTRGGNHTDSTMSLQEEVSECREEGCRISEMGKQYV